MVMLTCVNCHRPVTSTDGICEFCGAVLPSSNYPKSNVSTLTCPGCKAPLKLGADLCEHCGLLIDSGGQMQVAQPIPSAQPPSPSVLPPAPLPVSFSSSALAGQCPHCGRTRTAGKKFCGGCGYSFTGNLQRGQVLNGRYRIEQIIGQGGMGVVYLAEDTLLKRKVVTKTLLDGNDKHLVAQSVKEREYLAKINHPNIVSIYDFVTEGTSGYIVMEYVQGKTLKQIMEEQGRPFDVPTAIRLMLGVLPAFAYLAKLNYVYCDFKPHNVMMEIRRDGTQNIKLIDLGTVIEYELGVEQKNVFCTLGYFAPEATKYPSPQTDLYSICRTLAYMVTHMNMRQPLFGMPPIDKYQVFQDYPAFYRFLCKGTHSDPKQRFQSVEELEEQLRGVLRLCAGGATGELVTTRQFVSSMLASAGRIARCGETALDEQDSAIQILRTGDRALHTGDYRNAQTLYEQALRANPLSIDAYVRLIETLIEQGNDAQAEKTLNSLRQIASFGWKTCWCEARLLEAQGKFNEALERYRELSADLPGELPPLQAQARLSAHLGDHVQAVNLLHLVLYAEPGNIDALFEVVQSLLSLQRWDDAIQALNRVSKTSARYIEAQLLICDLVINRIKPLQAHYVQLATQIIHALDGYVDNADYYFMRGEVYRAAWQLACAHALPANAELAGVQEVNPRSLGVLAEQSYRYYLQRMPDAPNREEVIRRKFEVAPWHLF